jgi:lipoprotein-anchoring transpeptidase ErfK/SrfK
VASLRGAEGEALRTVNANETVQSTSMFKRLSAALLGSACMLIAGMDPAAALDGAAPSEPAVIYGREPQPQPVRVAYNGRSNMGGGFIEFLFGDGPGQGQTYAPQQPAYQQQPAYYGQQPQMGDPGMQGMRDETADPRTRPFDPRFEKQLVDYHGKEGAGTIVVDTPNKFLYLVEGNGKATRYGIGVGRPGFTWSGVKTISAKREWPAWTPPPEMLARRPDLPRHMEGGPENPLGARAMYLGSSLYRIHGSNEPWTIGTNVSSGCIRMRNEDVIDLYGRVGVGTRVVVM